MSKEIPEARRGINYHRLVSNHEERIMAEAWVDFLDSGQVIPNRRPDALDRLLDSRGGDSSLSPKLASDRDRLVANTVIQWLGSPVGSSFLRDALEGISGHQMKKVSGV